MNELEYMYLMSCPMIQITIYNYEWPSDSIFYRIIKASVGEKRNVNMLYN